jgi:isopenicillin N synthase-like dioxygenase
MDEVPIVDISGLRSADLARRQDVALELGAACRNIGFFYATGHGVPPRVIESTFSASRYFFLLPTAEKLALSQRRSSNDVGYGAMESERLGADAPGDFKETFDIALELPANHSGTAALQSFRGPNLWPALPGWRESMLEFLDTCWVIGRLIHRGFCLDLGLPENFFEDKLDAPLAGLRLLHYPASDGRTATGQLGAGEHTDYGNLTLLVSNGVAGLQLRNRTGIWLDAPAVPGTFICNIGDFLMRWTNDIYVSTPHRVLPPQQERYSVAFFLNPNPDARVEPIEAFGRSRYPPIENAGAYLRERGF